MQRFFQFLTLLLLSLFLLSIFGCEQIFTYNFFQDLKRDSSNYSTDQALSLGDEALNSGDKESMKNAYDLLKDKLDDPNLSDKEKAKLEEKAGELAVGLSGINDAFSELLTVYLDSNETELMDIDLNSIFDDIDSEASQAAVTHLLNANDGGEELDPVMATMASIAEVISVANDEEMTIENIDPNNLQNEDSEERLLNAGTLLEDVIDEEGTDFLFGEGGLLGDSLGEDFVLFYE